MAKLSRRFFDGQQVEMVVNFCDSNYRCNRTTEWKNERNALQLLEPSQLLRPSLRFHIFVLDLGYLPYTLADKSA